VRRTHLCRAVLLSSSAALASQRALALRILLIVLRSTPQMIAMSSCRAVGCCCCHRQIWRRCAFVSRVFFCLSPGWYVGDMREADADESEVSAERTLSAGEAERAPTDAVPETERAWYGKLYCDAPADDTDTGVDGYGGECDAEEDPMLVDSIPGGGLICPLGCEGPPLKDVARDEFEPVGVCGRERDGEDMDDA
jgi:hypothetical protein